MDLDAARAHLATHHRAVLATRRRDGGTQMSPVLVALDDAGRVVVSSRETAYKVRQLRANPQVAVCVLPDDFFGKWIQVEGTASIVGLPEAMDGLVGYYRRISGEHPDWSAYRAAMEEEKRVLITIEITRAGPDRTG